MTPKLGDYLTLTKEWTFTLHEESRNTDLIRVVDKTFQYLSSWREEPRQWTVTLPVGTKLKVDRIYIRCGMDEFNSVTFRITKGNCPPAPKFEKTRFWVKLDEVNGLEFE